MSWTCCYEMTLVGTPESRSYMVILPLRLYLLRRRAVGLNSWCREVEEKGRQAFGAAMMPFVLMGLTCCIRNASMREACKTFLFCILTF